MPSAKYTARANALVEAIDLARQLVAAMPRAQRKSYATHLELLERMVLDPAPRFAKLASLAELEDDFFTYWNEATGKHVDAFWRVVAIRGLPFDRKAVSGDRRASRTLRSSDRKRTATVTSRSTRA